MKLLRPTTPGQRQRTIADYSTLTKKEPEKSLTFGRKRRMGRSKAGTITTRHKGGGNKRLYREIDFKQNKMDIPGKIIALEYDPNRSAFISLIQYHDGEKRYALAVKNMKVGDKVITSETAPLEDGNRLPLAKIPVGFFIHNMEMQPGRGGQVVRSAGSSAKVMANEGKYTHIRMPSSEVRKVLSTCLATIGVLSNPEHNLISLGKGGRIAMARHQAYGARNSDESVRSSAWRRRGLPADRSSVSENAVGKACAWHKNPQKNHTTNKFIVSRRVKK